MAHINTDIQNKHRTIIETRHRRIEYPVT